MMPSRQLALALPYRPALERAAFIVGQANVDAVAWIDRWPDWPGQGLVVSGPAGSGKSHLIEVWRAKSRSSVMSPADIAARDLADFSTIEHLGIDGIEGVLPDAFERALLHAFNIVRARGGTIMVAMRAVPTQWVRLPDLSSRLATLATVTMAAPDEALLEAVLRKHFDDRQVDVASDVLRYVLLRCERSFSGIAAVAAALDRAALDAKRPITIGLARTVLTVGNG